MFEAAFSALRSATLPRAVLLLNHVVGAEPAATARLAPRAGQVVSVEWVGLPAPLADLGLADAPVALQITPAGLFELIDASTLAQAPGVPTLRILVDGSDPLRTAMRAATGERPEVRIEGDAAFAGDIQWLIDHVRWDWPDDLAQRVGPMAAHEFGRFAAAVRAGLERLAAGFRPDAGSRGR